MTPASAITPIRPAHSRQFAAQKMFAARATMSAPAKNLNLINKIALFQFAYFCEQQRYLVQY